MSHVPNFNPPIPSQVAAMASASHHVHWGGGLGEGSLVVTSALVLTRERSLPSVCLAFPPLRVTGLPSQSKDVPIASQGPLPPDADPTAMNVRRACPLARQIFYWEMMDQVEQFPALVYMGACISCGQATGNFCDPCVSAGRTFEVPSGQIMSGSSICGPCEESFHCYVCAGVVPSGPIGQPTVPIRSPLLR